MKKILIVDDLRPFVEEQRGVLSRADFRIFTASSGEEALKLHREEKVDLIITDLDMPGMPGDELVSLIRKDHALKRVSVIMVCRKRDVELERCANCGADTYLTRPLNPAELRQKAEALLEVPYRKEMRVLCKVEVKGKFKAEPFFCTSKDISASGMLLETEKILAKSDRIRLSFFIPEEDLRVQAEGEVMRVAKTRETFRYGVKFSAIGPEEQVAVKRFVDRKTRRPPIE